MSVSATFPFIAGFPGKAAKPPSRGAKRPERAPSAAAPRPGLAKSLLGKIVKNVSVVRMIRPVRVVPLFVAYLVLATPAGAQTLSLDLGNSASTTGRIVQLVALLTVLSLAPSILVMVTSFTRIVVVLSFLRSAIGLQQSPPNAVLVSLALFLTAFVMAPTLNAAYSSGIEPLIDNQITEQQALDRTMSPIRRFMLEHVREKDLRLFDNLANTPAADVGDKTPLRTLIPAFMISELRRAFEIGFLLFLPFLIIDMVVASILMSMGMMMLPPVMISLPFKLIFFVLVDGWYLVAGSLVQSYATGAGAGFGIGG